MYGLLFGVAHDAGWVDREVGDILVLAAVAHVELAPLALPEVGKSTWPHGRLHNHDAVLLVTVQGVCHGVGHRVAKGAEDPCGVATLARLVRGDGLEAKLVGV